jgi:hypothetical protein
MSSNNDTGCGKVAVLLGAIASLIAIIVFLTGKESMPELIGEPRSEKGQGISFSSPTQQLVQVEQSAPTATLRPTYTPSPIPKPTSTETLIPSPTPLPDTLPGSVLEVGQEWRQSGLSLTLLSFSFVTDDNKWSIYEPLGILTDWEITNRNTKPILIPFQSARQFFAIDNLGRNLEIEGFRTGANTCAAFRDCDETFALEAGQSRDLSCASYDCPSGLKIDVDLADPRVTEVIITVNIADIKDARWRVQIR